MRGCLFGQRHTLCALCFMVFLIAGCLGKEDDAPLPGERTPFMAVAPSLGVKEGSKASVPPIAGPAAWPQVGGSCTHAPGHPPLTSDALRPSWSVSTGAGAGERAPLTAHPVVAQGTVFVMDAKGVVHAVSATNGALMWAQGTWPKDEDPHPAGGIATANGRVYATTGGTQVVALDAKSGQGLWQATLSAPARAAPTPFKDKILVVTLDSRVIVLRASDGQEVWAYRGVPSTITHLEASAPAALGDMAFGALPGGEIIALNAENGQPIWSALHAAVSASSGGWTGDVADVAAPLVLTPAGHVLALGTGGKLAALDIKTGALIWAQPIGGTQMPWLAGGSVFVVGSRGTLAALDVQNGSVLWSRALPVVEKDKKDPRDEKPLVWYGPVLTGGRLILVGSDGRLAVFDPKTGTPITETRLGTRISQAPIPAGGHLYLMTDSGRLLGF